MKQKFVEKKTKFIYRVATMIIILALLPFSILVNCVSSVNQNLKAIVRLSEGMTLDTVVMFYVYEKMKKYTILWEQEMNRRNER